MRASWPTCRRGGELQQPIQCRIDELVAGTRAQVILKLFGDDAGVLKQKAAEMAAALGSVPGRVGPRGEAIADSLPHRGVTGCSSPATASTPVTYCT